jgi:hypothetical protein
MRPMASQSSRHTALAFSLLLSCCGGQAPASSPAKQSVGANSEPAPAPSVAASKDPETETPAADVEPASPEDIQAVLQLVIDDESLQQYSDLGSPHRLPFKMTGKGIPASIALTKGSSPVKIVSAPDNKNDPVMVITELEINATHASVRFRYDVAKLRGSANLEKRDYGWELVNSYQSQH